ncbi:protein mono-ADP-ribosyltransferase PARP14-like isoform X3 [Brienomyrus brachyistius]|uniref:protein mono-ADP-ribosyltransferase PARP14-like isoform X3 n=1 Tax=Brienomyrus brachyistius TaxID=42636 RepID=UPI0020B3C3BF|nr:protein mono-ADP-ribosyltransferase PARP14-like isoform X3 [Brienomyrus brachyistius]
MGEYKYPLFFEVSNLDEKLRKNIETYFQIRRKSGGGECGSVELTAGGTCKIAFKYEEDQQRVLQKGTHTLETPSGPVVLSVRQDADCSTDFLKTPAKATSEQTHHFHSISGAPPCGKYRKAVQLDPYLIRYLTDNIQAGNYLQHQLSTLFYSFQLQPETENMVVKGAPRLEETSQMDTMINRVFEQVKTKYCCHYEADPLILHALQNSPILATKELQVYSEPGEGFSVLVGSDEEVQESLSMLEKRHRNSVTQERISTTCSLGKPRLFLLGKDLEELKKHLPGVKVSQTDLGQLVIEGPAADVLSARKKVTDMAEKVQEQLVAGVSLRLLSFLRTQGVETLDAILKGIPAKTEITDTGLSLLSLTQKDLGDAQKALLSQFSEEEIPLPDSLTQLPKLKELLPEKELQLNKGKTRVQVCYNMHSVQLLGYTDSVTKLNEVVKSFLKDQAIQQFRVALPYPDLSDQISNLFALLDIDNLGIQVSISDTRSPPELILTGPRHLVTAASDRMSKALSSLVQEIVTVDSPGAHRYFKGPGQEYLQVVSRTHHCLVQMKDFDDPKKPKYQLEGGLCVQVRLGNITKENVDAIVNAANENLEHLAGVAAALSWVGGPEVQQASRKLVQRIGKVATGTAVETTPGKLPCKVLIHAVGPTWSSAKDTEAKVMALLEKAVKEALELAERRSCRSLAMPCISSGIFGVPVDLCAKAIVMAVRAFGRNPHTLHTVMLVDSNENAVRALQSACDALLGGMDPPAGGAVEITDYKDLENFTTAETVGTAVPESLIQVKITVGTIEDQQVDALVSPMLGDAPLSSKVGKCLLSKGGRQFSTSLEQAAQSWNTVPGGVHVVDGEGGLVGCSVIFLHCVRWDGDPQGAAVQTLRKGLRNILCICDTWLLASVAFPMLGTGISLAFPHRFAAQVLLEEIQWHEQNRTSAATLQVHIVIHPSDKHSTAAFQACHDVLNLRGFQMAMLPDQTSFYHWVSVSQDEITVMMGSVKLQLIFGDIIKETTDVIVNSANFINNQTGVSNTLLMAAGQKVLDEFNQVRTQADGLCTTQPGSLACKAIVHIYVKKDLHCVQKLCGKVLKFCQQKGYKSVAFPAVGAGAAGLDPKKVAASMLDGMATVVRDLSLDTISHIRIILLLRPIFETFRCELDSRIGQKAQPPTLKERGKQMVKKLYQKKILLKKSKQESLGRRLSSLHAPPATFCVTGPGLEAIRKVQEDLKNVLQRQLCERELKSDELEQLTQAELDSVIDKAQGLELSIKEVRPEQADDTRRSFVVQGLKEEVWEFLEVVQQMMGTAFRKIVQEKDEELVAVSVKWSIGSPGGQWQELEQKANYIIEKEYLNNGTTCDIDGPGEAKLKVDLRKKKAFNHITGFTYQLKRVEVITDVSPPKSWDVMAQGELVKKVLLQPGTEEYQEVTSKFLSTAVQQIVQIERVQNIHLWRAYSAKLEQFREKNGEGEIGEKLLYHGTSAGARASIEKGGLNRSFTGQHGTAYGIGVYFAVEASYSANPVFSPPDNGGLRYMYVAKVLTGRYTVGKASMKFPPSRPGPDPDDRFDSLVDNDQNPKMFVIFHDDQAYPNYLITFK